MGRQRAGGAKLGVNFFLHNWFCMSPISNFLQFFLNRFDPLSGSVQALGPLWGEGKGASASSLLPAIPKFPTSTLDPPPPGFFKQPWWRLSTPPAPPQLEAMAPTAPMVPSRPEDAQSIPAQIQRLWAAYADLRRSEKQEFQRVCGCLTQPPNPAHMGGVFFERLERPNSH